MSPPDISALHVPIGFHVSISGGLARAVAATVKRGCSAMQVFCGAPSNWRLPERAAEEFDALAQARADAGLGPIYVHSCYLISSCSPNEVTRQKGIARLTAELQVAARMDADGYVLHPGSAKGRPMEWAVDLAAESIVEALAAAGNAPALLLENTASQHGPGGRFDNLAALMAKIRAALPDAALGVTLDSCHAWAAGHDLSSPAAVQRMVDEIDATVGIDSLQLIHLNDARDACGSYRDRHAEIGQGEIGVDALRNFLRNPTLSKLPIILETPGDTVADDVRNLEATLKLLA
jgi:deoxyribonuclease IV